MQTQGGERSISREAAFRHIRAMILRGEWSPGSFITESEIAAQLGMSRTPVREAFLRLEAEGFLNRIPQKGAVVVPMTYADAVDVIEIRGLIEIHAAKRVLATQRLDVSRFRDLLNEQTAFANQDDTEMDKFIGLDIEFHATLVASTGNQLLTRLYHTIRDRQLRLGTNAVLDDGQRVNEVIKEHEEIVAALEARDELLATRAIEAHLEATLRALNPSPSAEFGRASGAAKPAIGIL